MNPTALLLVFTVALFAPVGMARHDEPNPSKPKGATPLACQPADETALASTLEQLLPPQKGMRAPEGAEIDRVRTEFEVMATGKGDPFASMSYLSGLQKKGVDIEPAAAVFYAELTKAQRPTRLFKNSCAEIKIDPTGKLAAVSAPKKANFDTASGDKAAKDVLSNLNSAEGLSPEKFPRFLEASGDLLARSAGQFCIDGKRRYPLAEASAKVSEFLQKEPGSRLTALWLHDEAENKLKEAAEQGDEATLTEVAYSSFYKPSGLQAMIWLAAKHYRRGDITLAASLADFAAKTLADMRPAKTNETTRQKREELLSQAAFLAAVSHTALGEARSAANHRQTLSTLDSVSLPSPQKAKHQLSDTEIDRYLACVKIQTREQKLAEVTRYFGRAEASPSSAFDLKRVVAFSPDFIKAKMASHLTELNLKPGQLTQRYWLTDKIKVTVDDQEQFHQAGVQYLSHQPLVDIDLPCDGPLATNPLDYLPRSFFQKGETGDWLPKGKTFTDVQNQTLLQSLPTEFNEVTAPYYFGELKKSGLLGEAIKQNLKNRTLLDWALSQPESDDWLFKMMGENDDPYLIAKASRLIAKGTPGQDQAEKIQAELERVRKKHPNDPILFAELTWRSGARDRATLTAALEHLKNHAQDAQAVARLAELTPQFKEAGKDWLSALEPTMVLHRNNRTAKAILDAYLALGEPGTAAYNRAVKAYGDSDAFADRAVQALLDVYVLGGKQNSLPISNALTDNLDHPTFIRRLVKATDLETTDIRTAYEKALAKHPKNDSLVAAIASALGRMGSFAVASLPSLETALKAQKRATPTLQLLHAYHLISRGETKAPEMLDDVLKAFAGNEAVADAVFAIRRDAKK